jgi:hypothetical protein
MILKEIKLFIVIFPTKFLQSHSYINTTKLLIITCTLVVKSVTIKSLEYATKESKPLETSYNNTTSKMGHII